MEKQKQIQRKILSLLSLKSSCLCLHCQCEPGSYGLSFKENLHLFPLPKKPASCEQIQYISTISMKGWRMICILLNVLTLYRPILEASLEQDYNIIRSNNQTNAILLAFSILIQSYYQLLGQVATYALSSFLSYELNEYYIPTFCALTSRVGTFLAD